ncbi:hypothetical protein [Pseudoalteromonas aurantia]|uniref:Cytochrome c family protein n=1 Tax=Pseudoalteromonas aurantia 208 TaxID=1314867 RepID=A0ABR9ECB3_9GAMM|nr:hypothetical protein [Pseudoalteromonas aurantia]MBE0368604.1 hypothetical protein [Pseudoalteromonas aurantia 208]
MHNRYVRPARAFMRRLCILLAIVGINGQTAMADPVTNPCTAFGTNQVTLTPQLPNNFNSRNQTNADCTAWQQFIYANWPADPNNPGYPNASSTASAFGNPTLSDLTVWQSYLQSTEVFSSTQTNTLAKKVKQKRPLVLHRVSKTGPLDLSSIGQATGEWLTDQRGNLVYYDIRLNPDEVDYIYNANPTGKNLTWAAGQIACAQGAGGFRLPSGYSNDKTCEGKTKIFGGNVGAMEIKAAWIKLPEDGSLNYRYLTTQAVLLTPGADENTIKQDKPVTVGLIGLHIIRHLPGAPQMLWTTFEQVDNTPDAGKHTVNLPSNPNRKPRPSYTLYNPECDPKQDIYYQCKPNWTPNMAPQIPCDTTSARSPDNCIPYSAPLQVNRVTPVESTANNVNAYAWSLLPANSVFNYYRLIDVQWPNNPSTIQAGATPPLTTGDITPSNGTRIVANTTLETFVQNKDSCMDCHKYAATASQTQTAVVDAFNKLKLAGSKAPRSLLSTGTANSVSYASYYSFVFSSSTTR